MCCNDKVDIVVDFTVFVRILTLLYIIIVCTLCRAMACFEWNLHNQISVGDSILSTTFCGDHIVETTFLFHYPL